MPKRGLLETNAEERISSEEGNEGGTPTNLREISEYESQRLERIEENKKRMEAMGLKKMAYSLMGSVKRTQKMKNGNKGKKKMADEDEDEEYNPTEENEEPSTSEEEEEEEFSLSLNNKVKRNNLTAKKSGSVKKRKFDSGLADDDDSLMQAISLSLQDSSGFLDRNENLLPPGCEIAPSHAADADSVGNNKPPIQDDTREKKRKKPITSRVQMTEDEMIIHFFQFDETGKGGITLLDIRRLATSHDFTWSEKEIADMISFFDTDGDGKISLDDFRKIIGRCNMLKTFHDG